MKKGIHICILLLFFIVLRFNSKCQTTDTIYSYIGKFTIDTLRTTSEEIKCLKENFKRLSDQYYSKSFIEIVKINCQNIYKLIDVENEKEAIQQWQYSKRKQNPLALADNYMIGTISKTTNNYQVSVKVKDFNNSYVAMSNFYYLKFSECYDVNKIKTIIDSLVMDVANTLCPKNIVIFNGGVKDSLTKKVVNDVSIKIEKNNFSTYKHSSINGDFSFSLPKNKFDTNNNEIIFSICRKKYQPYLKKILIVIPKNISYSRDTCIYSKRIDILLKPLPPIKPKSYPVIRLFNKDRKPKYWMLDGLTVLGSGFCCKYMYDRCSAKHGPIADRNKHINRVNTFLNYKVGLFALVFCSIDIGEFFLSVQKRSKSCSDKRFF
jgi:hypothetical protein